MYIRIQFRRSQERDAMNSTICKWGNSLALRLPKHIADQVRLAEGTSVDLLVEDGILKVTPLRPKFKLSDLLEGEPARAPDAPSTEIDWGEPAGDEAW
jgi:antitoxin MazE